MTIFLNQGKFYKQNSQVYTNNKGSNPYSYNPKFLDYREYQETLFEEINLCPDCVTASGFSYPETCTIEDPEPPTFSPISGITIFIDNEDNISSPTPPPPPSPAPTGETPTPPPPPPAGPQPTG
jgi:hypothetical protein